MAERAMSTQLRRWHLLGDAGAVVAEVRQRVADHAEAVLAQRDRFVIVLAGGTTPARLYRELRSLQTDWSRWWVLFGDERCLPVGDEERNDTMAHREWLDAVPIPPAQILAIPAELGPEQGARQYAETLADIGTFDLVLLGLGEDGHTASLFPGHSGGLDPTFDGAPVTAQAPVAVPVANAPKPPPERVSLSAARLGQAAAVWFLVTGQGKLDALQRWHHGEGLPAAAIAPPGGVDIFTDCNLGA